VCMRVCVSMCKYLYTRDFFIFKRRCDQCRDFPIMGTEQKKLIHPQDCVSYNNIIASNEYFITNATGTEAILVKIEISKW